MTCFATVVSQELIWKEGFLRKSESSKPVKICLAASAGGHLSQLLKLADSWTEYKTVCITSAEVGRNELSRFGRVYIVGECNRQHPIRVVNVLLLCAGAVLRERPDVVISTGAAPGLLVCLWGKLLGAKIVWIDSIANVEKLSLSGRLVQPLADLFLTQWPEFAERYDKVEYVGTII